MSECFLLLLWFVVDDDEAMALPTLDDGDDMG